MSTRRDHHIVWQDKWETTMEISCHTPMVQPERPSASGASTRTGSSRWGSSEGCASPTCSPRWSSSTCDGRQVQTAAASPPPRWDHRGARGQGGGEERPASWRGGGPGRRAATAQRRARTRVPHDRGQDEGHHLRECYLPSSRRHHPPPRWRILQVIDRRAGHFRGRDGDFIDRRAGHVSVPKAMEKAENNITLVKLQRKEEYNN